MGFKLLLDASHFLAWQESGDFPSIVLGWSKVWILVIPTTGGLPAASLRPVRTWMSAFCLGAQIN